MYNLSLIHIFSCSTNTAQSGRLHYTGNCVSSVQPIYTRPSLANYWFSLHTRAFLCIFKSELKICIDVDQSRASVLFRKTYVVTTYHG